MFQIRHTTAALALLASLAAPAASRAEGRFSADAQIDFTNAYIFRGIVQEKRGFIAQPWGEVYASLYSSEDGFVRDVSAGLGVWLSIHSKDTLATNGPRSLYETDYYPMISVDFAGGVNLTTTYYFYTSPNGAWHPAVQELNFKLSMGEGSALERISPWINFAIETRSTSLGTKSGSGVQLGIGPTFYENDHFSVSGSAEIGLAIHNYYEGVDSYENTFGYADLGVGVTVPITDHFGTNLGFKYYLFGDDLKAVNGGHGGHGVVTASLTASF